ncbi:hypothetical protein LXA43DRAFT_151240 [Ganoderma leucocontextum]|nr:hypothetical protein LXA43DRAFT_151240 [Ganoderma leucocontextum]
MAAASNIPMCQRVEQYVSKFQEDIVDAFEKLGPNAPSFKRDSWLRAQGGRPRSIMRVRGARTRARSGGRTPGDCAGEGWGEYLHRPRYASPTRDQADA